MDTPADVPADTAGDVALDASSDSPVDTSIDVGDALGFNVASLPNLAMWLESNTGISTDANGLTEWADLSGNGNNLIPPVMGAGYQPQVSSPGVGFDCTLPCIGQTAVSASLDFGVNELLIEAVVRFVYTSGEIWLSTTPYAFGSQLLGSKMGVQIAEDGGTVAVAGATTLATSTTYLLGIRRTGSGANTTIDLRVNGASDGQQTGPNLAVSFPSLGVVLEGGTVDELVVVNGAISSYDLAELEAHLMQKFGI